ncbi:MAG: hypothetical protein WA865_21545 [Spirulinaceae cyanobacterium]
MEIDLESLKLTPEQLEDLVELDTSTTIAVDFYRAFVFKKPQQIFSVLITELALFVAMLISIYPITLIILRNSNNLPTTTAGTNQLLLVLLFFSLVCLAGINAYIWRGAKSLKSLARLMEETDKYNSVVHTLEVMERLDSVSGANSIQNRGEVFEILQATKRSLISAVNIEKVMRKHQGFLANRQDLVTSLENNLTTLITFDPSSAAQEYQQLLNDTLQIGMTVHKEVGKLQSRRRKT